MRTGLFVVLVALSGCGEPPPPAVPEPQQGPFQAEQVPGLGDPQIVIVNNTALVITVEMTVTEPEPGSAITVVLEPQSQELRTVPAGTYVYAAEAGGVRGTTGSNTFQADKRYTWTFALRATPVSP